MTIPLSRYILLLAVGWLPLSGLLGCDSAVHPIEKTDRPFTLYGYLNPKADTQAVRVFALAGMLQKIQGDSIDARIQSTELETGRTHTWRDSLVQLENGDYRHIFWAPFTADYGHTYRLEAVRSDGATSTVSPTTPSRVDVDVSRVTPYKPVFEIQIIPDSGAVSIMRPRLSYRTATIPPPTMPQNAVVMTKTFRHEEATREGDGRWTFKINLDSHYEEIYCAYRASGISDQKIALRRLTVQILVASAAWDPEVHKRNPEILARPGTMSNVDNGYGFVSSAYPESVRWRPPEETLEEVGFGTERTAECGNRTRSSPR